MPPANEPDWAAVRHAYVETDTRVALICAAAGITAAQLKKHVAKEKWRRRFPRPFLRAGPLPEPARPSTVLTSPPPPSPSPLAVAKPADRSEQPAPAKAKPRKQPPLATPAARRRLVDRLAAAISLKLEQLERRMDARPQGHRSRQHRRHRPRARDPRHRRPHRQPRQDHGDGNWPSPSDTSGKSAAAAADLADEADRFRRELAERLAKTYRRCRRPSREAALATLSRPGREQRLAPRPRLAALGPRRSAAARHHSRWANPGAPGCCSAAAAPARPAPAPNGCAPSPSACGPARPSARRIALVGPTQAHVRAVMIDGVSGLMAVHPAERDARSSKSPRPARLAERRHRAILLGRRSGGLARSSVRRRLVRRARPLEPRRPRPGTCCSSACASAPIRARSSPPRRATSPP